MDIETKTARLDTLSVTIQALHVNGKQMTLSVFRQLPETDAIDENSGLLFEDAEYWGTVNYDFKKNGRIWVVLSRNGKLYRAEVYFSKAVDIHEIRDYLKEAEHIVCMLKGQTEDKRSHRGRNFPFVGIFEVDQLPRFEVICLESKDELNELETIHSIGQNSLDTLRNLPQLFIAV